MIKTSNVEARIKNPQQIELQQHWNYNVNGSFAIFYR